MLVLVIDLLVIVLIAVLVVISFGISTKVIWSAIIALSLYFFIAISGWNVNKTGTHPHFVKRWSPTGLKEIIGFCKKVRMAGVLKPTQKLGREPFCRASMVLESRGTVETTCPMS